MAGRTAADVKYPAAVLDVGRVCQQLRSGNSRRDRYTPEYNDSDNGAGSRNDCDFYHRRTIASLADTSHVRPCQGVGASCENPLCGPSGLLQRLKYPRKSKHCVGPRCSIRLNSVTLRLPEANAASKKRDRATPLFIPGFCLAL